MTGICSTILLPNLPEEPVRLTDVLNNNYHYPTSKDMEREFILNTLRQANENPAQIAKLLEISVRNLYRKLEAYEVQSSTLRFSIRE